MIVLIVIIILFLLLAIFLMYGKGSFLIAGYNTLSQEEKEKYDQKALCRSVGKLLFSIVFCMLLMLAADLFNQSYLLTIGGIGMPACIIFYLIYSYRHDETKFRK